MVRCFTAIIPLLGLLGFVAKAADLATWPSQYLIRPWETARLTPADVVGPDGIVYPNLTGVGVTGGIPDVNNTTIRSGYTVYNVKDYGAAGDGVTDDDAPVAAALAAARGNASSGVNKSILYFPTGTYLLTDPLTINENNLVVDGDGQAATILKLQPGNASTAGLITIQKPIVYIGYIYPTANIPRGSNTATFDKDPAANGYSVGTWVRMLCTQAGAGKTMTDRYSNPANNVVYTDALYHFGRIFFAKVTAINSATKTMTFDRSFVHDYYTDEVPEMRTSPMLEQSGVQDLAIETTASTVTMFPMRFDRTANCWIKNVAVNKAKNWPMDLFYTTRFEVRDCVFNGSWTDINQGSVTYLGWIYSTDSLMDTCQANDLRHMPIFQMANRCVVRNSTFTGTTIQSPQLHGRMPLDNLVETSTFTTRGYGTNPGAPEGRGLTAYASDGAATLRHGIEGPRNVFYNNNTTTGAGFVHLQGISENLIFAYNRVLKTDDVEAYPSIVAMDRTFDTIIRGNVFQSMVYTPFISLEDTTCTGWSVTDNRIYGSNGYLWEGDSEITTAANNRFFPAATTPDASTTPEVASIYAWQQANANTARLVLVIDNRTVTDTGGTTTASVVRVKSATTGDLTVNLSTDIAGISIPATVTIPAGETRAQFTITGASVSGGEKTVTLIAAASGLLGDIEKIQVLDQDVAQPNFGLGKMAGSTVGLPSGWKARNNGQVTVAGSQSYASGTDTWTVSGGGLTTNSYDATFYRSGRKFVYQTVDGDGEIVARLTSVTGESQVGLMIADDEATGTDHIWIENNGRVVSSSDLWDFHGRPSHVVAAGTKPATVWLRLKRVGTVFTAYRSTSTSTTEPTTWTQVWTKNFYNHLSAGTSNADYLSRAVIDGRMHFGMFINSGSLATAATATFTGVRVAGAIVGTTQPPAVPTNLSATLGGATANIAWTDNSTDETGFLIEYQIGSGAWNALVTTAADVTSYSHGGLLDGLTYSYRVHAVRSSDNASSAASAVASVSVPLSTVPLAASDFTANGVSVSAIQLAWSDNAYNESGYQIERSLTSGSGFTLLTTLGSNTTGYTDAALPEGVRYFYRVRATNALGNSPYTAEAAAVTWLNAPVNLLIASASSTEVRLSWTDASAAETGFSIERSTTSGSGFVGVGSAAANATGFTDTTVVGNTTYYYRIRATNSVSQSDVTAEVSVLAASVQPPSFYEPFNYNLSPATIVGQAGSGNGGSGLWLGIAGTAPREQLVSGSLAAGRIAGVGNQLRMSQTSDSSRIALVLDATAKAVVTPAANASRIFWMSYLVKTSSAFNSSTSITPGLVLSTSGNSQILSLQAHSGGSNRRYAIAGGNLTTVSSARNAISSNTTYCYISKVTITDTDGNTANGLESIAATLWQYPAGTLPPSSEPTTGGITRTATTVTSRAIDRIEILGGSANSTNQFHFDEIRLAPTYARISTPLPPPAPGGLLFSGITTNAITLTWTDNAANETSYKVQRALSPTGPYADVATLAANSSTFTDTGLTGNTAYHYRVRCSNADGDSDPASGSATTDPLIGYTISGMVTLNGTGLAGVTVSNGTRSAVTATDGSYTLNQITSGNHTLTPTLAGQTFTPSSLAITVSGSSIAGQDFAASTGLLIVHEPFNYTLATTNPDPDTVLNSGNGLPATNTGGTPSGTGTGLRNNTGWGTDQTVVDGLAYSNSGGILNTSANALRQNTSTGFSTQSGWIYRNMTTDPFASHRYTGNSAYLGWNGSSPSELYFSVLLNVSATGATTNRTLVLNSGRSGSQWNIYLRERSGNWALSDQAGTEKILGPATAGQSALFVGRYSFSSTTTMTLEVWLNPMLGQPLGTATHSLSYTAETSGGYFMGIQSRNDTVANILTIDEFRLGTSAAAVLPYTATGQPAPAITSALTASGTAGSAFTYTITGSNSPTSYDATGLPSGLTVNTATGVISGTPSGSGTSNVTISATNAGGTDSATLEISIAIPTYTISGSVTNNGKGLAGVSVSDGARSAVTAVDGSYAITGVPAGSYTLTPSFGGYGFTPESLSAVVTSANLGGKDFTALTPIQSWYQLHGLPTEGTGDGAFDADPDGDGVKNLIEYALGGFPDDAASAPRPTLNTVANHLTFSFLRAQGDVTYTVEATGDLANPASWTAVPYTPVAVGETQVVTDTEDASTTPRRFMRLRVIQP
jgi:hypothetical protein